MYLIFFLMMIAGSLCGMQQPAPVVALENYTLVSSDGQEVVFDGTMVRALLPELANKFRQGMKEANTGKISTPNFDQAGLQVLKRLLVATFPVHQNYIKQLQDIDQQSKGRIESIVSPNPNDLRTQENVKNILAHAQTQKDGLFLKSAEGLHSQLETLPSVGDYFLEMLNSLILWKVTPILGKAMGIFATEHIDLTDDHYYESLKKMDPQVQLIYLFEVPLTVENIYRAFELFKDLVVNPAIITQQENSHVLNLLSHTLVNFTYQNISKILEKHPNFKTIILDPALKISADALQELLLKDSQLYTRKIMETKNNAYTQITQMGADRIGINVNDQNLYIYNIKEFKIEHEIEKSKLFNKKNKPDSIAFRSFGSNGVIAFRPNELVVYDFASGKVIHSNDSIRKPCDVQELDSQHVLLLYGKKNEAGCTINGLHILDLQSNSISEWYYIDETRQVRVIDPQHIVFVSNDGDLNVINVFERKVVVKKKIGEFGSLNQGFVKPIGPKQYIVAGDVQSPTYEYISVGSLDLQKGTLNSQMILVKGERRAAYPVFILSSEFLIYKNQIWHIPSSTKRGEIEYPYKDLLVIDKNHLVIIKKNQKEVVFEFLPQVSTLTEILDEIGKNSALQAKKLKRPAIESVQQPFVPAAAQGLKPEEREVKRPREEKEKRNG